MTDTKPDKARELLRRLCAAWPQGLNQWCPGAVLDAMDDINAYLAALEAEVERLSDAERAKWVTDPALRKLLTRIADRWAQGVERYARCGSDQHNTMPGHWPVEVKLTVDDCRYAYAAHAEMNELLETMLLEAMP